jgi:citrate synthase
MTEFETAVSHVGNGVVNLRGYSLEEVMTHLPFSSGVFLSIIGRLPSAAEARLLDALLNSLLDHGFVASTITAARYIASGNPSLVPAVAGGLLACGSNTVSPQHSFDILERAAQLREGQGIGCAAAAEILVDEFVGARRRLPGLGHPTHKASDFRADVLFTIARESGLAGDAVEQFGELQRVLKEKSGKHLPINIDGAMAAVAFDIGWTAEQVVAFALMSVLPGLIGHVIEELHHGKPLRHITDGTYIGPAIRPLPSTTEERAS